MAELTRILSKIEQGDSAATEKLLPLVYEELRALAAQRMAAEAPGQTLQATALVQFMHSTSNPPWVAALGGALISREVHQPQFVELDS